MGTLSELPTELLLGWAVWVIGGLLLMLWFVRQSGSPHLRHVPPAGPPRLSGSHAVARPLSGRHAAARPLSGTYAAARSRSGTHTAVRPLSGSYPVPFDPNPTPKPADPFDQLRALLDSPDDSTRSK